MVGGVARGAKVDMYNSIEDNTMLVTLTVKDLKRIVAETTAAQMQEIMKQKQPAQEEWVAGVDCFAKAMNRSTRTVSNWKKKGLLDGMYKQIERTIYFNIAAIRTKLGKNYQRKQ